MTKYIGSALQQLHYSDVIISAIASEIAGFSIVYSIVCWGAYRRKHQSSASQRANNAENVSIWWRHHAMSPAPMNNLRWGRLKYIVNWNLENKLNGTFDLIDKTIIQKYLNISSAHCLQFCWGLIVLILTELFNCVWLIALIISF